MKKYFNVVEKWLTGKIESVGLDGKMVEGSPYDENARLLLAYEVQEFDENGEPIRTDMYQIASDMDGYNNSDEVLEDIISDHDPQYWQCSEL